MSTFDSSTGTEEASGTCLSTMPEYVDVEYQQSLKMGETTLSDLVRVLLLAKHGAESGWTLM